MCGDAILISGPTETPLTNEEIIANPFAGITSKYAKIKASQLGSDDDWAKGMHSQAETGDGAQ